MSDDIKEETLAPVSARDIESIIDDISSKLTVGRNTSLPSLSELMSSLSGESMPIWEKMTPSQKQDVLSRVEERNGSEMNTPSDTPSDSSAADDDFSAAVEPVQEDVSVEQPVDDGLPSELDVVEEDVVPIWKQPSFWLIIIVIILVIVIIIIAVTCGKKNANKPSNGKKKKTSKKSKKSPKK